eukprot:SM000030S11395  [mRNA]  locus=s30:477741:483065:- [translate_table: standard]
MASRPPRFRSSAVAAAAAAGVDGSSYFQEGLFDALAHILLLDFVPKWQEELIPITSLHPSKPVGSLSADPVDLLGAFFLAAPPAVALETLLPFLASQNDLASERILDSTLASDEDSTAEENLSRTESEPGSDNEHSLSGGLWHYLMCAIRDSFASTKLAESLIFKLSQRGLPLPTARRVLVKLYGVLLWTNAPLRLLLTEKLLLSGKLPIKSLQFLLPFAVLSPPRPPAKPQPLDSRRSERGGLQADAIGRLTQQWASYEFIRSAPLKQQICLSVVSAAIAKCMAAMTKIELEATPSLLAWLLQGVSGRLESPLPEVQQTAEKVAMAFSMVLDPANPLRLTDETPDPGCGWEGDWLGFGDETVKQAEELEPEKVYRDNYMDSPAVVASCQSDKQALKIAQEDAGSSDDESLVAYNLADEEDLDDKLPRQLRTCAAELRKGDDPLAVERALRAVEPLVRALPDELDDFSAELAQALIHVQSSSVAVEGEEEEVEDKRRKGLVVLLSLSPLPTISTMIRQLYSPNVDLSQRLLILDVMEDAVAELTTQQQLTVQDDMQDSTALITEIALSSASSHAWDRPGTLEQGWREAPSPLTYAHGGESLLNYERRFERRTDLLEPAGSAVRGTSRRWGRKSLSRRRCKGARPSGLQGGSVALSRPFPPLAAAFMLPMMREFDKRRQGVDMLGRDFVLLGRMLQVLGKCVEGVSQLPEALPLALTLLELIKTERVCHHCEVYVRRSAAYAASRALSAMPPAAVVAAMAGTEGSSLGDCLSWVRDWARSVVDTDQDDSCSEMAALCLQLHSVLASKALACLELPPNSFLSSQLAGVQLGPLQQPKLSVHL